MCRCLQNRYNRTGFRWTPGLDTYNQIFAAYISYIKKKSKSHLISNLNLAEETQGTQARTKWELINLANASFFEAFSFKAVQNLICILKWGGERQQTFTPYLISFRRRNAPFLFFCCCAIYYFPIKQVRKFLLFVCSKYFQRKGFRSWMEFENNSTQSYKRAMTT